MAGFFTPALNELQVQKVIHWIKANANLFSSLNLFALETWLLNLKSDHWICHKRSDHVSIYYNSIAIAHFIMCHFTNIPG